MSPERSTRTSGRLVTERTAVWAALAPGLVALCVQTFSYSRVARLGPYRTLSTLLISLALDVCIVALKVMIVH